MNATKKNQLSAMADDAAALAVQSQGATIDNPGFAAVYASASQALSDAVHAAIAVDAIVVEEEPAQ